MNSRERARENKSRYITMKGGPCHDCGIEALPPYCFHFDHRDVSQKQFNLSDRMHWAYERIKDELDKCDLVCANCHAIRTFTSSAMRLKQGQNQKGKKRSAEVRARMAAAQRGHSLTIESRMKISASRKGQINTPAGWHHTAKTREKLRLIALARPRGWHHSQETIEKMRRTQRARAAASYA